MENELRDHLVTTAFSRANEDHSLSVAVMIQDPQRAAGDARNDHVVLSCGHHLVTNVEVEWHLDNQSLCRFTVRNRSRTGRQPGNQHQHRRNFQNLLCHLSSSTPRGSLVDVSTLNLSWPSASDVPEPSE